ncbi:MAG: alpha/beta hydrolase fold domain-containing protein [Burkholderiales bacterium]|nr:alpha/beta hydrolase fold domain-containing protein [Burkholderiales bacterium]
MNVASDHLETIEIETRPSPSHSIIWLHGLGADGNDFVPVVQQLGLPNLGIRFIFPHAPMMPVTINGGFVMRAWYDILDAGLALHEEDERGLRASESRVSELLDNETRRGIPASRIVLAGFSQGGAIALQTGLRYRHKLAGMLILSSYLPLMSKMEQERSAANQRTPVFMGHGQNDNVVPIALAIASRAQLTRTGYCVDWREYPMVHAVCNEELADISDWLTKVLL